MFFQSAMFLKPGVHAVYVYMQTQAGLVNFRILSRLNKLVLW